MISRLSSLMMLILGEWNPVVGYYYLEILYIDFSHCVGYNQGYKRPHETKTTALLV